MSETNIKPEIRKIVTYEDTTFIEGFKTAAEPWRMFAAAAVFTNPWAGKFVDDLRPGIQAIAPVIGEMLSARVVEMAGGGDKIQAYGKAAIVGMNGEIEHASGVTHTLRFGNFYREAVGAKSYLSFTNLRGPANTAITIPMMDKVDVGRRSHYLTLQFAIGDAPGADEILVALGGATNGRPHHRIGDRYQDLAEMGNDVDNPAGV